MLQVEYAQIYNGIDRIAISFQPDADFIPSLLLLLLFILLTTSYDEIGIHAGNDFNLNDSNT